MSTEIIRSSKLRRVEERRRHCYRRRDVIVFGSAFVNENAGKACSKNIMRAVCAVIFHDEIVPDSVSTEI